MAWREERNFLADATPEYIAWFRSLPGVEGDRDITSARSKKRVNLLRRKVHQRKFVSPHWWVAFCIETGLKYRLNGQASSLVMEEADGLLPPDFQVFMREILANTSCRSIPARPAPPSKGGRRPTLSRLPHRVHPSPVD